MKKILLSGIFVVIVLVIFVFVFSTNNQQEVKNNIGDYNSLPDMREEPTDSKEPKIIESQKTSEQIIKKSPILKNLGINIEPLNEQTNLAGDLLFSKKLVYDDGRVFGNKVLVDFGVKEKYFQEGIGNIEYWFYVPLNTNVKAPLKGTIKISFFEHTKDWGVSIIPEDSDYIVSFEHLVDLKVQNGQTVNEGDILGFAAPRNTFNNEIAMVELAVWKGGVSIIKYCPFDFLDESLKPIYKEKINILANEWEEFIDKNVYEQEKWVSPACLVSSIKEN